MKKTIIPLFLLIMLFTAFTTERPLKIFMIGDSTMANKDTTGGKQERGGKRMGYGTQRVL